MLRRPAAAALGFDQHEAAVQRRGHHGGAVVAKGVAQRAVN
jgi:hypothetical protein